MIIFFHSSDMQEIIRSVQEIIDNVEKQYDCRMYGGIGSVGTNRAEIRRSYREADTACNLAMRLRNRRIKVYSDVDMELLLENISKHDRELFENVCLKTARREKSSGGYSFCAAIQRIMVPLPKRRRTVIFIKILYSTACQN